MLFYDFTLHMRSFRHKPQKKIHFKLQFAFMISISVVDVNQSIGWGFV